MDRIEFVLLYSQLRKLQPKAILDGLNAWELEEKTVNDIILTAPGEKKKKTQSYRS